MDIPLYDFKEIIGLGHENRLSLLSSCKKGTYSSRKPASINIFIYRKLWYMTNCLIICFVCIGNVDLNISFMTQLHRNVMKTEKQT